MKIIFEGRWTLDDFRHELDEILLNMSASGLTYVFNAHVEFICENPEFERFEFADENGCLGDMIVANLNSPRKPLNKTPREKKTAKPQNAEIQNIADFRKGKS